MYHWESKNWPLFEYDTSRVAASISEYSKKAYSIEGALSQLSSSDHDAAYVHLLVEEALSTSAIEGEKLNWVNTPIDPEDTGPGAPFDSCLIVFDSRTGENTSAYCASSVDVYGVME